MPSLTGRTVVKWVRVKLRGTLQDSSPAARKLVVGIKRPDAVREKKMMGLFCLILKFSNTVVSGGRI